MRIMDELMETFMDWAMYDDIGDLVGIREDAPNAAKEAYKEFNDLMKSAERKGVKI